MSQSQDLVDVKCFRPNCGIEFKALRDALLTRAGVKCVACHTDVAVHMFHGDQPIHPTERCPTCNGPALLRERCRCSLYCIKCPEGHRWHRCPTHKVLVPRYGHDVKPTGRTRGCTCEAA